jgi:hypothetical protein
LAIAAGASGQRKNAVLEIEVINQAGLAQTLGNLLGLFVLGFKGVDQIQTDEVGHFDFDGHGATVGGARVAHACFVAGPTFWTIDVNNADGRFHG